MKADPLLVRANAWLAHDPDPNTREELSKLLADVGSDDDAIADKARADLTERFVGPLEFGTAGLRGIMGAGESLMNRAVVLRTTYGLGKRLLAEDFGSAKNRGVVIGYDGRHLSRQFAEDTACVLAEMGIPSHLSPHLCPTPLCSFAVVALGAAAGVMVTASHNPPKYNGYKVYWGNGAQIIPPYDTEIAALIAKAPAADAIPRMTLAAAMQNGLVRMIGDSIEERYLDAVARALVGVPGDRAIPIVYTPLHGTGERLARRAFLAAGFTNVTTVPEQAEPDGDFPTVAFPNPEEKGTLDLSFALARRLGAEVILANDPDADRLGVAVRKRDGSYLQLTGNQVGVLLGHYLLTQRKGPKENRLVLASLVSSPMLGVMAHALDVRYEEVLTGFKWIANRSMDLERTEGATFVFGFEEALGYSVSTAVRDKDGISAAVVVAELAAARHAEGKSLLDELDAIARTFGVFTSGQKSLTYQGADGAEKIKKIMAALRANPPAQVGTHAVVAFRDYEAGTRRASNGATTKLTIPPSNMVAFELEGGSRIIARPSGTEPKVKFYFDLCEATAEGEDIETAEARLDAGMKELIAAFSGVAGV